LKKFYVDFKGTNKPPSHIINIDSGISTIPAPISVSNKAKKRLNFSNQAISALNHKRNSENHERHPKAFNFVDMNS